MGRWHTNRFDVTPADRKKSAKYTHTSKELILEGISKLDVTANLAQKIGIQGLFDQIEELVEGPDSVDRFLSSIDSDPFFGLVHLMDTHAPYDPKYLTEKAIDKRKDGERLEEIISRFESSPRKEQLINTFIKGRIEREYSLDIGDLIRKYDATVAEADQKIGKLIKCLKRKNIYNDTIIIILADHGESLDEHGIYFDHHGLYDKSLHIPLILSHPSLPSRQISQFVQITDIAPTILDMFDIKDEIETEGDSLEPLINNKTWDRPNEVFAMENHTTHRHAVRTEDWKYIELATGDTTCRYCEVEHGSAEQLFNINTNPEETENVASKRQNKRDELSKSIESFVSSCEPPNKIGTSVHYEDEEEIHNRLEALGYR